MKNMVLGILFTLLSFNLVSCAKKQEESTASPQAGAAERRFPIPENEDPQTVLDKASVGCRNSSDGESCPTSVAMMARLVDDEESGETMVGLCTATLVEKNIMLTNGHCIDQRSCEKGAIVVFPDGTKGKCEKVLQHVQGFGGPDSEKTDQLGSYEDGRDYAFFKLKKDIKNKMPQKISRDGLLPDTQYRSWVMTPAQSIGRGNWGTISKLNCRMLPQTQWVAPAYSSADQGFVSFTECQLVHGNSGSALVGSDGSIRGVVQGMVDLKKLYLLFDQNSSEQVVQRFYNIITQSETPDMIMVGTNLRCTEIPDLGEVNGEFSQKPAEAGCDKRKDYVSADTLVEVLFPSLAEEEFRLRALGAFQQDSKKTAQTSQLKFMPEDLSHKELKSQMNVEMRPVCVNLASEKSAAISETAPVYAVTLRLNKYSQFIKSPVAQVGSIVWRAIRYEDSNNYHLSKQNRNGSWEQLSSIPACTPKAN